MNQKIVISKLEQTIALLKSNISVLLLAIVIYILWYNCFLSKIVLSLQYYNISLGHIGYIGLLIVPFFLIFKFDIFKKLWIFFSALAILDLKNLIYITNEKIDKIYSHLFDSYSIAAITLLFLLTSYLTIAKDKDLISSKIKLVYVFFSSIFFMFVYHFSNYYMKEIKHISNEDRSIMINGLEIHHINYGIILLVFLPIVLKIISKVSNKLALILLNIYIGFIYGTVFDEAYYYMLKKVSDEAYLYLSVIGVQVLITIIIFALWKYFLVKAKNA